MVIRVGTRNSQLALTQTNLVVEALKREVPGETVEVVSMTTTGDQILDSPLHQIGSKSLFTKELEHALLSGQVDLVVHSLKDLPTQLPDPVLTIGAVLEREDPRDVVVMSRWAVESGWRTVEDLPAGSCIGTSSVRRIAQLKRNYPHLEFKDIRGNLNTRLKKLDNKDLGYHAIVLAYAGVHRMKWNERISEVFPCHDTDTGPRADQIQYATQKCYHAVGQGALAIECRLDNPVVLKYVQRLEHRDTRFIAEAERSLMSHLEGGCSVPIGVSCIYDSSTLKMVLNAIVCSIDGVSAVESTSTEYNVDTNEKAIQLGIAVAKELTAKGAKQILEDIKK